MKPLTSADDTAPRYARVIEVHCTPVEDGTVYSTSDDLDTLSVVTLDEAGARVSVPSEIARILSDAGEPSIVLPAVSDRTDILGTWVSIPLVMVEAARRAQG